MVCHHHRVTLPQHKIPLELERRWPTGGQETRERQQSGAGNRRHHSLEVQGSGRERWVWTCKALPVTMILSLTTRLLSPRLYLDTTARPAQKSPGRDPAMVNNHKDRKKAPELKRPIFLLQYTHSAFTDKTYVCTSWGMLLESSSRVTNQGKKEGYLNGVY